MPTSYFQLHASYAPFSGRIRELPACRLSRHITWAPVMLLHSIKNTNINKFLLSGAWFHSIGLLKNGNHTRRAVFGLSEMVGNSNGYTHNVQPYNFVSSIIKDWRIATIMRVVFGLGKTVGNSKGYTHNVKHYSFVSSFFLLKSWRMATIIGGQIWLRQKGEKF